MRADKETAIQLRRSGKSYQQIVSKLHVPKSTLSGWFRKIPENERLKIRLVDQAKEAWARNIREFNLKRTARFWATRAERQRRIAGMVASLSYEELFLVGVALYWAEGYKRTPSTIRWCNSDPTMVRVMMKFFRTFAPPEARFHFEVHAHPNGDLEKTKKFWAQVARTDPTEITVRTYASSASRGKRPKERIPYGTFRVGFSSPRFWDQLIGTIQGLAGRE